MPIAKLFKSRAPVMGHVFRNGKTIHFLDHTYTTNNQAEIDELTEEANSGHPNIFIDPDMTEIDTDMLSPMAVLTARIREEERAKILAAMNTQNDMGKTEQGKLEGISNSESIRGLQVMSEAQGLAAGTSAPEQTQGGSVKVGTIKPAK